MRDLVLSKFLKDLGFKSVSEVSMLSGESRQTLDDWYKNDTRRFKNAVSGAILKKQFELTEKLNNL
ncbi:MULTISPECIES: hypothetical protein [Alteromonas]|jgi:hypothetical protein|uniref:Uncharacterized protein n=1 Tax=Alteromonas macleodii TaxID=28108 RepID=A0A126Q259_ALTMA|nr:MULTISPECIES: hypothetical protein [Alteromonas]AMJ98549.1 hypothetical protein AVL55_10435 [Alteromonas macleodii]AUI84856.1 hypothetical protein TE101_21085 [Alteromonas macleodii]MCG7639498.1 hypothetical protein [Alteromonas sp. CNT1-28]OES23972.1 hypothetical protein BFV94_4922 [Alteromonas macleodii]OES25672.1 hypothetical protein BFV95_4354 [Alteromonas macleodii]|tara:strand:+ start:640 stop:837 length:198 start_codon:yes stop_codon:yes gene_type:complete